MTIELSIPIESLTSEGVAQALAGLVLALGGHSGDTSEIGRRPSSPTTSWEEFHASLTPASQDFLALLRERGRVELEEAVEALGFKQNKAMGGLTGALTRKAANVGIQLPYQQRKTRKGQRFWVWKPTDGEG